MAKSDSHIAEIQGSYGPITVSEMLIQKIWMRRDFETDGLKTRDGAALRILDPGVWNLQEGPDFKDARLEIGGRRVEGDVEVHFYARNWRNHGHSKDGAFNRVVLHIVLFEPSAREPPAATSNGKQPATLVLLPWLRKDIEEYAEDDAILSLEQRDQFELIAPLLRAPASRRRILLMEKSAIRLRQKVAAAQSRIARFGWRESCHISCLEILGYRRNRAPMAALALRYPLGKMATRACAPAEYVLEPGINWKRSGLRPANRPEVRLGQYCRVLNINPDWPSDLRAVEFPVGGGSPSVAASDFRKRADLPSLRRRVADGVLAGEIGGTRLDTLVCDGFIPLLAALQGFDLSDCWNYWYRGDSPDSLLQMLRLLAVADGRRWVLCNGYLQDGFQWLLDTA